jgi:hypothetical protein
MGIEKHAIIDGGVDYADKQRLRQPASTRMRVPS